MSPYPIHTYVPSVPPATSVSRPLVKPLQVYVCRNKVVTTLVPVPPSTASFADSLFVPASLVAPDIDSLPIALRKGKHTCTSHHIAQFVSCDHLFPSLCAFTISVTTVCVPNSVSEALFVPCWRQATVEEMTTLHDNGFWKMVQLPCGKAIVSCRWVFIVKYLTDGTIVCYKACLVAKGFTHPRLTVLTTPRPSLPWPRLSLFVFLSPSLLILGGPYISWM